MQEGDGRGLNPSDLVGFFKRGIDIGKVLRRTAIGQGRHKLYAALAALHVTVQARGVLTLVVAVFADAVLVHMGIGFRAALHYGDITQVLTCAQSGQVFVFKALPFTLRILLGKGAFLSQQVGGCD